MTYSAASDKNWTYNSSVGNPPGCMEINGFGASGAVASNDWLISPEFNLTSATAASIKFELWAQYTDNGNPAPMQIYILENYTSGDPLSSATNITNRCEMPTADSKVWTPSGNVNISNFTGKKIRLAFHYTSSGAGNTNSTKWRVDNVAINFE